jgi:dihydroxyacetone kinase
MEIVRKYEIGIIKKVLMKVCHDIIDARDDLNLMDKELGDSDTGDTLSRGCNAILDELSKNNLNAGNPHKFLITLSDILMRSMGGSSGAIFSIFFQCASNAFCDSQYCISNWLQALSSGIDGIMRYGKAEIGDRTLLDSLCVGYNEMKITFNDGNTLESVQAFARGCKTGCENTKCMFPKSGRSAYAYADKDSDYKFVSKFPDSGAYVISIISNGILDVLQGHK